MTGANVPYHLRSNKAVERSIFLEFLTRLSGVAPIHTYGYVGFGSLHFEDFKLLHSMFSISEMTSIEINDLTYRRQQFSLPISCVKLFKGTCESFISTWEREHNTICWLDYTNPRQIGAQIREFQELLGKMEEYDIVKITINANPKTLGPELNFEDGSPSNPQQRNLDRFNKLRARIQNFLPQEATPDMVTKGNLPKLLGDVLERAGRHMMSFKPRYVLQPITSFVYADSDHQMLSCTGIILPDDEKSDLLEKSGLDEWEFLCSTWANPQNIEVPELTMKERMTLDSLLPNSDLDAFLASTGIELSVEDDVEFIQMLGSYKTYYKHYPYFSKILL